MSTVRPEFGPTLPALLGRRRARGLAGAVLGVVLLVLLVRVVRGDERLPNDAIVPGPPAFTLGYQDGLRRVATPPGALLALSTPPGAADPQSMVVRRYVVPPHRGDITSAFLDAGTTFATQLRAGDASFASRGEGRARVAGLPGYQLLFQVRREGRLIFGKRLVLVPDFEDGDPQPREGLDLTLLSARSDVTPNVDAVGNNGLLKSPLRSLRFGTERP